MLYPPATAQREIGEGGGATPGFRDNMIHFQGSTTGRFGIPTVLTVVACPACHLGPQTCRHRHAQASALHGCGEALQACELERIRFCHQSMEFVGFVRG